MTSVTNATKTEPLKALTALGQSIWLDNLSRHLLDSGDSDRSILPQSPTEPHQHGTLITGSQLGSGDELELNRKVLRLHELEGSNPRLFPYLVY